MSLRSSSSSTSPTPSKLSGTRSPSHSLTATSSDFLLLVFIHGFKGSDTTFEEFPERLKYLLTQTIPHLKVESLVFPAYDTKGELDKAVVKFADWLTSITVEREVASGGGAGKAKIVLCGHSMGGLLAADSLREFVSTRPDPQTPLWPKIIACLAFDTPYLGLNPNLVKHNVTKAADHVNAVTTIGSALFGSFAGFRAGQQATGTAASSSRSPAPPNPASSQQQATSGWARWAAPAAYALGGAILAGAAAGGAYYAKEHLGNGYQWMMDHMKYVGNLWDESGLNERVEALVDVEEKHGVVFRNFYTSLPPSPPGFLETRTFVVLPRFGSRAVDHFVSAKNQLAQDEIGAHTGMFSPATNDGYYDLGLSAAKVIRDAYVRAITSQPSRRSSVGSRASSPQSPQPRPASPGALRSKGSPGAVPLRTSRPTSPRKEGKKVEDDLISF